MNGITVVMPSLMGRVDMRERALRSVAAQTLQPEAVVIVIGRTPWDARNSALKAAETDWAAFLDDDDEWDPQHLELLADAAKVTGADLVYPRARIQQDGLDDVEWPVEDFDADRLQGGNYIPISYLVRTWPAQRVMFPPAKPGIPSDWAFLLRLLDLEAWFVHLPVVTWTIHLHETNSHNERRVARAVIAAEDSTSVVAQW